MTARGCTSRGAARTHVRRWLTGTAMALATCCATAQPALADHSFEAAMQLYIDCRWAAAYGRFALLADAGHAESARIALLMLRHGPRLYGSSWSASAEQIGHWSHIGRLSMPTLVADAAD